MKSKQPNNTHINVSRLNHSTFSNKGSEISEIMSMTTIRNTYAIQSRPHEITHAKNAYKDYFSLDHDEEEIQEQESTHRPLNSEVKNGSRGPYNIYADHKNKLALVLRQCCNGKLKQALDLIKNCRVVSTVRKLPTFSQNLNIEKINPQ